MVYLIISSSNHLSKSRLSTLCIHWRRCKRLRTEAKCFDCSRKQEYKY